LVEGKHDESGKAQVSFPFFIPSYEPRREQLYCRLYEDAGTHLVHELVLDQLDGVGVHAALPEIQELIHLIKK
jgi:hypothetical protein